MLAESLSRLLSELNEFEVRRRRLHADTPDRMALWPQFAEMGVLGAAFSEAHGGFAGDARTVAVVMAELGKSLAVEPYLGSAVIAGRVLQRWDDESARSELIEALVSGQAVPILAHDAGGNPFGNPLLTGKTDGAAIAFSGSVRVVRHADVASEFLLTAIVDGDVAIIRLPRDTAGLTIEAYRLIDGAGGGDLHLNDVRLPAASRLAFDAPAADVLRDALEWGVLGLAAETAGIIHAANAATFSYLGTRKQFGVVIGSFQALQHRAADMYIAAEEVGAALHNAIIALESGAASRSAAISAAKVIADVAGRRVGNESVQMHGGMGVSDELNVSHYARRLAAIRAELGTADLHRLRFGGAL